MYQVLFRIITQARRTVDVKEILIPASPQSIDQIRRINCQKLGNINERASADNAYNCHGLAFVGRLGHLFGSDLPILLTDNNMRKKAVISDVTLRKFTVSDDIQVGDIAIYQKNNNIEHSCIVCRVEEDTLRGNNMVNIKVLSKLGIHGEFFHSINDPYIVDAYGKEVEIWSNSIQKPIIIV
jgi:hypothetical protein